MDNYPHANGQFYWNPPAFQNIYQNYNAPTYADLQTSPFGMTNYYNSTVPDYHYSYQPYSPQEMPTEVRYYEEKPEIREETPEIQKAEDISLNNLEEMAASCSKKPAIRRKRSESREDFDDIDFLDTKDVCNRVIHELDAMSISQALFAQKVIQRTQGTLSDILRCPRPWSELKSGRQTYIKMLRWLELSEEERFAVIRCSSTPHPNELVNQKRKLQMRGNLPKKPRISFTPFQKKTLDALFNEVKNPGQDLKEILAKKLNLSVSTVGNYFMNERRKMKRMSHQDASQEE